MTDLKPSKGTHERAAALFRAIGHPQRLSVLLCLSRSGPETVNTLLAEVGGEQSALSHQLRVLREHRLVKRERRGREVVYTLADRHVAHIVEDAVAHIEETERSR